MKKLTLENFLHNQKDDAYKAAFNDFLVQFGSFDDFKEIANDIHKNGVISGVNGFTGHSQTVPYAKKHAEQTESLLQEIAECAPCETFDPIRNEKSIASLKLTDFAIAKALYGGGEHENAVYNAIAWLLIFHFACDVNFEINALD